MKWTALPAALMAAVSLYAGILYLWLYIRRRAELHNLWFAFTCLSIALYDIFCAGLYNAGSLEQGMFWQRFQFASIALFVICFSWFVFFLTRFRLRLPFYLGTVIMAVFIFLGLFVKNDLTLSLASPKVKHISLGNFMNITYYEVQPGPLYSAQYIFMFFIAALIFYVVFWYLKNSEDRRRSPLTIAMVLFFFAAINDSLVGAGAYPFIFVMEYVYLIVIIFMAYVLQNNFIDLTQEVEELNIQLEAKVNERTMELLFSEIGRGLYVDMLKELPDSGSPEKKASPDSQSPDGDLPEEQTATVQKLSRDISILLNFETLMNKLLEKAVEITGAAAGYLFMADQEGALTIRAAMNREGRAGEDIASMISMAAFKENRGIIVGGSKDNRDEFSLTEDIVNDLKGRKILCGTVRLRDDIVGTGYLERLPDGEDFTENDMQVLTSFMEQSVNAMEYAFLYQRMINQKMENKPSYRREPSMSGATEEKIKKAISFLEENYTSDISREGLAASLNMHPDSLGRFFKMYTDKKISEYINELRVREAAEKLSDSNQSIIDIAFAVGFESVTTFNRAFMKEMKITPTKFRKTNS